MNFDKAVHCTGIMLVIFKTKTLTQLYHAMCGDYTLALVNHPFILFYFWKKKKKKVLTGEREWKSTLVDLRDHIQKNLRPHIFVPQL